MWWEYAEQTNKVKLIFKTLNKTWMKAQTQAHMLADSNTYTIKFVSITHIQAFKHVPLIQRFY